MTRAQSANLFHVQRAPWKYLLAAGIGAFTFSLPGAIIFGALAWLMEGAGKQSMAYSPLLFIWDYLFLAGLFSALFGRIALGGMITSFCLEATPKPFEFILKKSSTLFIGGSLDRIEINQGFRRGKKRGIKLALECAYRLGFPFLPSEETLSLSCRLIDESGAPIPFSAKHAAPENGHAQVFQTTLQTACWGFCRRETLEIEVFFPYEILCVEQGEKAIPALLEARFYTANRETPLWSKQIGITPFTPEESGDDSRDESRDESRSKSRKQTREEPQAPRPDSQPEPDEYEILGIPRNAGRDRIKKAYQEKARLLHPDKFSYLQNRRLIACAGEEFKKVRLAYEKLMARA